MLSITFKSWRKKNVWNQKKIWIVFNTFDFWALISRVKWSLNWNRMYSEIRRMFHWLQNRLQIWKIQINFVECHNFNPKHEQSDFSDFLVATQLWASFSSCNAIERTTKFGHQFKWKKNFQKLWPQSNNKIETNQCCCLNVFRKCCHWMVVFCIQLLWCVWPWVKCKRSLKPSSMWVAA